jgi:hypothetical protein
MKSEEHMPEEQRDTPLDRTCGSCNAPICPRKSEEGKWFPDERICAKRQFAGLRWLRTQRRIQRRAVNREQLFTQQMLAVIKTVRPGIRGLDSNRKLKQ